MLKRRQQQPAQLFSLTHFRTPPPTSTPIQSLSPFQYMSYTLQSTLGPACHFYGKIIITRPPAQYHNTCTSALEDIFTAFLPSKETHLSRPKYSPAHHDAPFRGVLRKHLDEPGGGCPPIGFSHPPAVTSLLPYSLFPSLPALRWAALTRHVGMTTVYVVCACSLPTYKRGCDWERGHCSLERRGSPGHQTMINGSSSLIKYQTNLG